MLRLQPKIFLRPRAVARLVFALERCRAVAPGKSLFRFKEKPRRLAIGVGGVLVGFRETRELHRAVCLGQIQRDAGCQRRPFDDNEIPFRK